MENLDRSQRITLRIAGVVAVLSFLVAAALILDAGFGAEDFLIEPRAQIPWGNAVAGYFAKPEPEASHYYRPASRSVQRTIQAAFGTDPRVLHAWNIVVHLLATWLVYRLGRSLSGQRLVGLLAGVVFLVHPAHDEPLIWVSGINGLSEAACHLAALLTYDHFLSRRKMASGLLVVALFLGAMLFRESGAAMVLTLPVLWWYRGHDKRMFWPIGGVVAAAIAMGLWRYSIGVDSSLAVMNFTANPFAWARNLLFYTVQFLMPVRSIFRLVGFEEYYRWRDMLPSSPDTWGYATVIALVSVVGLVLLVRYRREIPRVVLLSVTSAVASIAPFLISRYTGMRLMYLFSGLLAIALAIVAAADAKRRLVVPVFSIWLVVMSVSLVERAEAWRQSGQLAGRIFDAALIVCERVPDGATLVFRGIPARHFGGSVFPVAFSEAILKRTTSSMSVFNYDDPHEDLSLIPPSAIWYEWDNSGFAPSSPPGSR